MWGDQIQEVHYQLPYLTLYITASTVHVGLAELEDRSAKPEPFWFQDTVRRVILSRILNSFAQPAHPSKGAANTHCAPYDTACSCGVIPSLRPPRSACITSKGINRYGLGTHLLPHPLMTLRRAKRKVKTPNNDYGCSRMKGS